MTNTATLNTSNKNTINYEEKRLKNKNNFFYLSETSQHTNRAIIKQSKTNSKQISRREREGGGGGEENDKIILTNKGK